MSADTTAPAVPTPPTPPVSTEEPKLREPFDRMDGEPSRAFGIFRVYRDLGAKRTIRRASEIFYGKDWSIGRQSNAYNFSCKYNWVERAKVWDEFCDREARSAQVEEIKKMNERHVAIAKAGLNKAILALRDLEVKGLDANQIARLISDCTKLERLAMGQPSEHIQQDVTADGEISLQVVERIVPVRSSIPPVVTSVTTDGESPAETKPRPPSPPIPDLPPVPPPGIVSGAITNDSAPDAADEEVPDWADDDLEFPDEPPPVITGVSDGTLPKR